MKKILSFERFLFLLFWIGIQCIIQIPAVSENGSKLDMDKFMNDYISEVTRTLRLSSEKHTINKRSNPDIDINQLKGLALLVGFQEEFSVPARFPKDLVLFSSCSMDQILYAATLEDSWNVSQASELVLYKYKAGIWLEKHRVSVASAVRIATEQIGEYVYIIVAQNITGVGNGSTVYQVNRDLDELQFVHKLSHSQFASHVIIWKREDMVAFAAIAVAENGPGSEKRYSTQSPVYQLLGSNFDMIDTLPTHNPQALAQFNIRSSMFVAVANFQDDFGETTVDSEIFRYSLATKKFILYQKLPTEAAVDIKYFCFQGSQITESFLIYASAFHKDEEGNKDYNAVSVVYKLSDEEYFVPFQALRASKVTSWLPVRSVTDKQESLTLLGASDEGVTSYQYDGWRFVPTGVHYDRSTFGPGVKTLSVFYHNDQTFISVANRQSNGYDVNVFSPYFKHHKQIEDMKEIISDWEKRMSQELEDVEAKMAELGFISQCAPSTRVEGEDADADADDYNRLNAFNSQLFTLQQQLTDIHQRIDQISYHTLTIDNDFNETTADITCFPGSCRVEKLEVLEVNGQNFPEFLTNVVNIEEPVEFYEDLVFETLALIDPLDTKMINGHAVENLVDWSEPVILYGKLKVEGEVKLENNISVMGTIDGVAIHIVPENTIDDEVAISNTRLFKTLNASELLLSDDKLSQVDFTRFHQSTLKTHGNQFVTEFQDFDRIEANEVKAGGGLYKAFPIPSNPILGQAKTCDGEDCLEVQDLTSEKSTTRARDSEADLSVESITLLNNEIIIPHDVVISGTVIIENGFLSAEDLVDTKYNVSARNLMEFGIPLNQSVMNTHFEFNKAFEAPRLTVDTLNGVDLESLVDPETSEPLVITARKEFMGGLIVNGTVHVTGTVNGVKLEETANPEDVPKELHLNNLTVYRVNSDSVKINGSDLQHLILKSEDGKVFLQSLLVEEDVVVNSIMVRGLINNCHLENMLQDTVYKDGLPYEVTGKKYFLDNLNIANLSLNVLNNKDVRNLTPEYIWKQWFSEAKTIEIGNLTYTGKLDGIEARDFGEWLLTEGDQTLEVPQTIDTIEAERVTVPVGGTFNYVDINHLLTDAIFLSDNASLNHVVFEKPVHVPVVTVGGRVGGLLMPDDIVLANVGTVEHVLAHKIIHGNVSVLGRLIPEAQLSSVNISAFCQALALNTTNLIITGDAEFKEEPNILVSINNNKWTDLTENVWLREDNINVNTLVVDDAEFNHLVVTNINHNKLEERLSKLVSRSQDQIMTGTFYFSNVTVQNGLEAEDASVGGHVQGIQLSSFINNVLLDGEDQDIQAYLDFNNIIIYGVFMSEGFVNNLNLSKDVMLADTESNTVTSSITVDSLSTPELILPSGALVSGVDLELWNKTAVKNSEDNTVKGNLIFTGQFDAANGIRVEGLVNGIPFDKDHVMLVKGNQNVKGMKTFSPSSKLNINRLRVGGYLNGLNIDEFYNQLVTTLGNLTMSGFKMFTSPLYSERVILPEVYQGHNLTWLELQLASPLPWSRYYSQLAHIDNMTQMANKSLAGQAYYLKKMNRMRDLEGAVLFAVPLKTDNVTVLAAVRQGVSRATLSLLHWNEEHSMFLDMPGTTHNVLRVAPSDVQSVTLPDSELAAYVTSYLPHETLQSVGNGEILRMKDNMINETHIYGGEPGTFLLSFQDFNSRSCFLVVADSCRVYCHTEKGRRARLPSFSCQNITEVTILTTSKAVHLLGLQVGNENTLVIWKLIGKKFIRVNSVPQFNPVSIAATTAIGPYVAVANKHRVGSFSPETIDIYRFKEETSEVLKEHSLHTISPSKVLFADLTSGESVMYVTSDNPASPLEVFVYRGILGYQRFAVDKTLPTPSDIHAFTDHHHRHFVIVTSKNKGCVLQMQFEGKYSPS